MSEDVQVEVIDREGAEKMLSANIKNRRMNQRRVDELADAMRRDEWVFNGEPIQIGEDGQLQNGQHRLAAVVLTDTAHRFVVVRGLPVQAQESMDTGAKRTLSDVLALRGEVSTHQLAAGLRSLWNYDSYATFRSTSPYPTHQQLVAELDRAPQIRQCVRLAMPLRPELGIQASVGPALRLLTMEADEEEAKAFWNALRSGVGLETGDPILVLRRTITAQQARPGNLRIDRVPMAAWIVKAWNAWREGREIRTLSWKGGGTTREPFPIVSGREPKYAILS